MGTLMLMCSITGREFSTGISIDEASFRALPNTVTKARCPHCDRVHDWWTRDARWIDAARQSEWGRRTDRPATARSTAQPKRDRKPNERRDAGPFSGNAEIGETTNAT
jgi:hypothetical protein